ncbi:MULTISPECIES: type I pantothenate kinase [Salinivibrio]|uniref:Pantothenate kinase n=1 Tax=Salinivibrio kushneri TaxID=1908198 RepID=A0AB36JSS9_9GAMM|nr:MULTISPECIES: type I pantothenate kinase [Salinivibrio]ODP96729.1 type I pantothenate kinase [Salinivibrio sp. BNH]OOE32047.1 type I pantothenate kinase [Salinivibrio kushneri]OOE37770.1 type I pantothenate kinase [Salinivibrio kushneri]OOE40883.1 type I pantothenate kinase [Salinivibrio kushneri]OOE40891.1 type I pantothenate kinase [Salinivibrio kushneri]
MNATLTPYLSFERQQWAELRDAVPMTLTEDDIDRLRGLNEHLSMDEVRDIYLPLSRLLNLYVKARKSRTEVLDEFLSQPVSNHVPYVIGIAGSVAVGKSTTARLLKALLTRWPDHPKVALVTTDGFLYPNAELESRGIMHKKGFPQSYDMRKLVEFVADVKSGKDCVTAPIYSHLVYDITSDVQNVEKPDILILEGLNVLQSGMDYPHDPHHVFISDFLDFSIYVDAEPDLLKHWYIERFMKFRRGAFLDPQAYFHHYTRLSVDEATQKAATIWDEINGKNLSENILPTRERASLILEKGANHSVQHIRVRK